MQHLKKTELNATPKENEQLNATHKEKEQLNDICRLTKCPHFPRRPLVKHQQIAKKSEWESQSPERVGWFEEDKLGRE